MSYSCNFKGECEPDPNGRFEPEEKCQQACYSRRQKDVNYLIQSFAPQTQYLAPSDAAEVVYRITGVRDFELENANAILRNLEEEDYEFLVDQYPILLDWVLSSKRRLLAFRLKYLAELSHPHWIGVDEQFQQEILPLVDAALDLQVATVSRDELITNIDAWYERVVGQDAFRIRNEDTNRIYTVSVEGMTYGDLVGFIRSIVGFYAFYVMPDSSTDLKVRSGA